MVNSFHSFVEVGPTESPPYFWKKTLFHLWRPSKNHQQWYLIASQYIKSSTISSRRWTKFMFKINFSIATSTLLILSRIRSWNEQKYKNNPGKLMVSTRIFSDKHVTCQPLPPPSAKAAVWRCRKGELGEWFRTIWRVEETNAKTNYVAS